MTRTASRGRLAAAGPATAGVLVLGLLAGCSSSGSSSSTSSSSGSSSAGSARTKTLIIAENEVPATFDPVQADNSTVDEVTLPTYDTLVAYDGSTLVGSLAKDYTVSPDGLSIAMTLRSGVTFHDGTPLTAKDVAYTLDRDKKLNIGVASLITAYSSTEVTDDTHLTIHLSSPYAPFLPALTRIYIVNSTLVTANAGTDDGQKWLATHDAGSGPYKFVSYTSGQQATFTQYASYWKGLHGQAKTVQFTYLSDGSTEKSALLNGDVDIAMDINPSDWASFKSNSDYTVDYAKTNVALYAFFKMTGSATSNLALRQAIAYAYDYPAHIKDILKGAGTAMKGPLASGIACADPSVTQPTYDLAKAKELVAANNLSGTTLTMTYFKATAEMEQAATLLQSALKKIGITLKLEAVTYPAYVQMASSNATTPDLGMVYSFPAYPDPDAVMYQNFDSKFIGGGQNWGGFSDPAYDQLVQKAQTVTDSSARCADYAQAQKEIADQYVTLNLSNPEYVTVMNKRVKNYTYQSNHHQTVDVYAITLG